MSTSTVVDNSFLECLKKSQLIEEKELLAIMPYCQAMEQDKKQLAEYLTREKYLTDFQAKYLLTGRYKGLTIGPYRIQNKIGSGGMGIVYLAEHCKLGRQVALKILPDDRLKDELAVERFYREARSVAKLDHPNIVKAHDVNEHNGMHYLVMEYIEGTNLHKYLEKKGRIPWKTVVNIVIQVCRGLQHAHERNFIHRDIKPANLLIDKQGQVKILDLGLARSLEKQKDNLTANLSDGKDVQGSIDYVSPEQAIGKCSIDIRADIYSLGATAYVLLTGQSPVDGTPPQKLLQHQMQLPTPPYQVKSDVPRGLSDIVMKMLAKRPDDRYATPTAVVSALRQFFSPGTNTLMQTAAEQPTTVAVSDSQTLNPDDTTITSKNSSTKRITKRTSTRRFKKKRKQSSAFKWAVLAVVLLLTTGVAWAGYQFMGNNGANKTNEVAFNGALNNRPAGNEKTGGNGAAPATGRRNDGQTVISTTLKEGQKLPDIIGEDLENTNFRLSDYDGKVVLLDFWGFWCPHCVKMIPHERQLVTQYQNKPFAILGVNNDKEEAVIANGMKTHKVNWRSFKDKLPDGGQISKQFGVKGFPTLILIDHEGVVRKIWVGAPGIKELDDMIESLVKKAETAGKLSMDNHRGSSHGG